MKREKKDGVVSELRIRLLIITSDWWQFLWALVDFYLYNTQLKLRC